MAAVTYGIRLWGLMLPGARLTGPLGRFVALLPVAVFAALVVGGLPGGDWVDSGWRLSAALVTGGLVWWRGSFSFGLMAGLGLYLLLRGALGA